MICNKLVSLSGKGIKVAGKNLIEYRFNVMKCRGIPITYMGGECIDEKGFKIIKSLRNVQGNCVVMSEIIVSKDDELVGE